LVESTECKITAPSNKKLADLCKKYNVSEEEIKTKAALDKRVINEALIVLLLCISNNLLFRVVE
jgi:hypothetical protein